MGGINALVSSVVNGVVYAVKIVTNTLLGFIVAIYLLVSKTQMIGRAKQLSYSIFSIKVANDILVRCRYIHKVFGGFIRGKLLDSFIIGIICFVGTSLLNIPFAILISVVVGVTNIIPFFGPLIGAIPCAILVLFYSPIKCIYFVIFVFALQQFDGNILGPKILGDSHRHFLLRRPFLHHLLRRHLRLRGDAHRCPTVRRHLLSHRWSGAGTAVQEKDVHRLGGLHEFGKGQREAGWIRL